MPLLDGKIYRKSEVNRGYLGDVIINSSIGCCMSDRRLEF